MNFSEMTIDELRERREAIAAEIETDGADLDALEEEVRAINTEMETRKAEEAKRQELRDQVAQGAGETREATEEKENKGMTLEEIRSSKEYVNAFANYIKTGNDAECRALLTTNVNSGTLPVPTVIEGRIRTAWQKNGLMDLVQKTYIRGNLSIGFELSADPAAIHTEGATANTEEALTFGVVALVPESIKKWITISDEALDMGGEEFLFYVYDELTYQIAKKAQAQLIAKITTLTTTATSSAVSVGAVSGAPGVGIVASAIGALSDGAENPVVVMNKATWAQFKAAQYNANYAIDPFEGLPVYFDNSLPAYTAATSMTTGTKYMIVGDFGVGAHANFPNGDEITIKYDDTSLAEKDLVKLVGREYVGLGIVSDKAFVVVSK